MTGQARVYQGTTEVRTHRPHLSRSQATVLARWSLGMVRARSGALTAVSGFLAPWLNRKETSGRQQLREFTSEAAAKRGEARPELAVRACFRPLLAWVVHGSTGRQPARALAATTLGDRFVVLALRVGYRGGAIPVAWTVLRAGDTHAWRTAWRALVRLVWRAVPPEQTVIVRADRGVSARGLYRRIVRRGGQPFLRVNLGGTFRPAGQDAFRPLPTFAPATGTAWAGTGTAFKSHPSRLDCPLLARWEAGDTDPWLIRTDRPPEAAAIAGYGVRAGIAAGFKLTKRGGWQWQRTRMTDPGRAERRWLAGAGATLWVVRVGGAAAAALPPSTVVDLTPVLDRARRPRAATRARLVGVFRRGWTVLLVALLNHAPLPFGVLIPEPWPTQPPAPARPRPDPVAA